MNYPDDFWQFSYEFHSELAEECMLYRICQVEKPDQATAKDAADFANALLMGGEIAR